MSHLYTALIALTCALSVLGCKDTRREQQAIEECAKALADGINTKNGEMVASRLSQSTLSFYDRLLPIARKGTRAQVLALPSGERAEVIGMRYVMSKADLDKTTGRGWVVAGVTVGGFGVGECARENLGRIEVDGDLAKARVLINGESFVDTNDRPVCYEFVLEDGVWKLDESSLFDAYSAWYEDEAAFNGREINTFLVDDVARSYGASPNMAVLDGLIR